MFIVCYLYYSFLCTAGSRHGMKCQTIYDDCWGCPLPRNSVLFHVIHFRSFFYSNMFGGFKCSLATISFLRWHTSYDAGGLVWCNLQGMLFFLPGY